jgi:hypothetical protein
LSLVTGWALLRPAAAPRTGSAAAVFTPTGTSTTPAGTSAGRTDRGSRQPVPVAGPNWPAAHRPRTAATTPSGSTAPPVPPPPPGTSLGGCPNLPADNVWHADVSRLPVAAGSSQYVASIGTSRNVHADFGSGTWDGGPIGIPITYVGAGQAKVAVSFDYAEDSDRGPYPVPRNPLVEGGPSSDGDRHVLLVDTSACRLYELFDAHPNANGSWHAGSGAIFDLRSDALRPAGLTSADAAGLPMVPGLVRYEEVAAGRIDHAIRVTVPRTQARYIWPARHVASDDSSPALPPMGLRLRLKAGVDISRLPAQARIIAQAMKTYGVIVADNGSAWYISGAPDPRWDNDALHGLDVLTGSNFEAVNAGGLMADPNSGRVR